METLEIVQILQRQNFEHDEAIRLAEAINGKSGLATKEDIAKLNAKFDTQFTEINAKLETKASKEDMHVLREELKTEMAEMKTTLKWIVGILISVNVPTFLLIIGMAVKTFL